MTDTGLGTYHSARERISLFSTARQQDTCTHSEQWALWSLRPDVSCGDLSDLHAHHCDFCQSETVRCDWRLWTGSGSGLAGGSSGAHYYLGKGFIKCY